MAKLFAFPSYFRIKNSQEFSKILHSRNGYKLVAPDFIILAQPNTKKPQLGIITGKKKFPHAVTRNWLKRIARESFRLQRKDLKNLAILVIFHKNAARVEKTKLRAEFNKVLKHQALQKCSANQTAENG